MGSVLEFENVSYVRGGQKILDSINWQVSYRQKWVIVGPNGAGKTTIINLAGAREYPSSGSVTVLDQKIGATNVLDLRLSIGFVARAQELQIPAAETVRDVILTAAYGVSGRWHESYQEDDKQRAEDVLQQWGLSHLADRRFGDLSDGERKRVLIARAVMTDPELLLLDEPAANIDLGGRESLINLLDEYTKSDYAPALIMVTHHVEEIPEGFTHAMLLDQQGRIVAAGFKDDVLTSANLSSVFGLELELSVKSGRYFAQAVAW